jgi:hypothetical protein
VFGPTNATITSVNSNSTTACNLKEGVYKFLWTVNGPCASGSDTIRVIVPAPTKSNTSVAVNSVGICDGRTTAELKANRPLYVDEIATWKQTNQLATPATILDNSSYVTQVSGLDPSKNYTFSYTIRDTLSNCSSTGTVAITYRTTPSIPALSDQVLACDQTSVNITYSGTTISRSLFSAPSGYTTQTVPTAFESDGSPLNLSNMDVPGTYVYSLRIKYSDNILYGCNDAYGQLAVTTSKTPSGVNAGTDQLLPCSTTSATLAGNTPTPKGILATWGQVSGPTVASFSNIHSATPNVTNLVDGKYEFKYVLSGGFSCPPIEDNVIVQKTTVNPQNVSAGTSATICYGGSYKLNGSVHGGAAGQGTWTVSPSSGITISDIHNPSATVTGMVASTAYIFTWTVVNKCGSASNSITVTTNSTQGPTASLAGTDKCFSASTTSVTLGGNNPGSSTGTWTQVSGPSATITSPSQYNSNVSGMSAGTYLFEWSISKGSCTPTRDTVLFTLSNSATTAFAGIDASKCSNSITMNATAVTTGLGTWSQISGPAGWSVNNVNAPNAEFTALQSGQYEFKWTVTNGACSGSSDLVKVVIDNVPTIPTVGTPTTLCGTGTTVDLKGNSITNGYAAWSVSGNPPNSPTITNAMADETTATGLITGEYSFTRTARSIYGLCPSSSATVVHKVVVNASLGSDFSICVRQASVTLQGNRNTGGTWSQTAGTATTMVTNTPNTVVSGYTPGSYTFKFDIPALYGCAATSDEIVLTVSDTAVTPLGISANYCNVTSINLSANNVSPSVGTWLQKVGPNTSTIADKNLNTSAVSGLTTGSPTAPTGLYLYTWTSTNGACTVSSEVRIENFKTPTTSIAGPNQSICPNTTSLAGNVIGIGIGNWSQVGITPSVATIKAPVNPKTEVTDLNAVGTYTFEWVSSNGPVCPISKTQVSITVTDLNPTPAFAGVNRAVCGVDTVHLSANNITLTSGAWSQYTSNPTSTIINDPASRTSYVTLSDQGTYGFIWTATNGACKSRDSVEITLSDTVEIPFAGSNASFCIEDALSLNANNPSPQFGQWTQLTGPETAGYINKNLHNTGIFGLNGGTYTFEFTVSNGSCPTKKDTVEIFVDKSCYINLSGKLFNDVNGLTDNSINGNGIAKPEGKQMYVSIIDGSGNVVATTAIAANGTYQFLDIPNYLTYSLVVHQTAAGSATPSLPANWVHTGENVGNGANGDAATNGIITGVTAAGIDIPYVNFGIQERPDTYTKTEPSQQNPGGTVLVTLPKTSFGGIDTSANTTGNISFIRITQFPPTGVDKIVINGITYTSSNWPVNGVTIPTNTSGQPDWPIQIDPIDGSPTPRISYATIDVAGFEDLSPGYVDVPFTLSLSGNVFLDGNGLSDKTVNGTSIYNPSGKQLYANLLDASGKVKATTPIASNGTYKFSGLTENTNYTVILDTLAQTINATGVSGGVPSGWTHTGENIGTGLGNDGTPNGLLNVALGVVDQPNVNFGIEELPNSDSKGFSLSTSPAYQTTASLTTGNGMGPLTGSDPEDGAKGTGDNFVVTSLAGMQGNILFYDADGDGVLDAGEAISAGDTIENYDPSKLSVKFDGNNTRYFIFEYAWLDDAGKQDPTPASYFALWSTPLPVSWLSFNVDLIDNDDALITWATASEYNNDFFEVEKSIDAINFFGIHVRDGQGMSTRINEYGYTDTKVSAPITYYRIKQVDFDGNHSYTPIKFVTKSLENDFTKLVHLYPNPASTSVTIEISSNSYESISVLVYNGIGQVHFQEMVHNNSVEIDVSSYTSGVYYVKVGSDVVKFIKI